MGYIAGHLLFGQPEEVPNRPRYFTMLRDADERLWSFYRFVRADPHHYLNAEVSTQEKDFDGFLQSTRAPMIDNGMTRQLSGLGYSIPFGGLTEAHLERAVRNLNAIEVVGLSEEFDKSLLLLRRVFGWQHLGYHSLNRTAKPASSPNLSAVGRAALDRLNSFDRKLVEAARERLENDWHQSGLSEDLRYFSDRFPPPGRIRDVYWRMNSRTTPAEWTNAILRRMRGT